MFGNTHVQAEACAAWCLAPPMSISRRTSSARMFDFEASRVMMADVCHQNKWYIRKQTWIFWNHQKIPSIAGSFLELLRVCWIWWCDQVRCFCHRLEILMHFYEWGIILIHQEVYPPKKWTNVSWKGTILNGNNMAKKKFLENWWL